MTSWKSKAEALHAIARATCVHCGAGIVDARCGACGAPPGTWDAPVRGDEGLPIGCMAIVAVLCIAACFFVPGSSRLASLGFSLGIVTLGFALSVWLHQRLTWRVRGRSDDQRALAVVEHRPLRKAQVRGRVARIGALIEAPRDPELALITPAVAARLMPSDTPESEPDARFALLVVLGMAARDVVALHAVFEDYWRRDVDQASETMHWALGPGVVLTEGGAQRVSDDALERKLIKVLMRRDHVDPPSALELRGLARPPEVRALVCSAMATRKDDDSDGDHEDIAQLIRAHALAMQQPVDDAIVARARDAWTRVEPTLVDAWRTAAEFHDAQPVDGPRAAGATPTAG